MSEDRLQEEVRKILRSEEDGLSPGFYTRTVARFAADRRRAPFGLAWSTVGLAAATIAAALIFIPIALRDELPVPEPTRIEKKSVEGTAEQDKIVPLREQTPTVGRDSRRDAPIVADPGITVGDLGGDDAKEQTVFEKPAAAPAPGKRRAELPAPEEPLAQIETESGSESPFARSNTEPADIESAVGGSTKNADSDFADETLASGGLSVQRQAAVELPGDAVGVGEIELLDTIRAQDRFTASLKKLDETSAMDSARARSKSAPLTRFVAIGPHPGLDVCSALELRRTNEAWEIAYKDSGSSTGAVACGIEVPDDGLEIRFQGWRIDE